MDPHPEPPPLPATGDWPTPPPAPPPSAEPGAYPPRRWPIVALVIAGIVTGAAGATVGMATGTETAASTAATLTAQGFYARAIAIDDQIAARTGPFSLVDTGAPGDAARAAEETVLAWAAALGRKGQIDSAVALYRTVTARALRASAVDALGALLLKASSADAAQAQYVSAISRLNEITKLAAATPAGAEVPRLLPIDEAGEADGLVSAGRAADAVPILDTVVKGGSAQAIRTADTLFPSALLAAGEEDLAHEAYVEALSALRQLVSSFPKSAEAGIGQALLLAPQTVTGTLVTHLGLPISDRVRLSSNYEAEPGGMYQTSGPFYTTTADSSGDFSLSNVPIGGPYVLEVYADGNWTTLINPTTSQPANPVLVTPLVPVDLTFVVLSS